jgi:hypothetical protein
LIAANFLSRHGQRSSYARSATPQNHPVLPADNVFDPPAPAGMYQSVAHGFVALLHPLTPGTHTIKIVIGGSTVNTTTIVVTPGH